MNLTNQIIISVIVTTKNEEKNIANCLKSIENATNSVNLSVEIIVVDNHSSDNTVKIAQEFTGKVYEKGPERSAQRNYGVKKAKGKYILYLDADMILSENVLAQCVSKCKDKNRIAVYIPEKIIGRAFWARVRDFERNFYNATVIDCVRFVQRDTFLEIDGFDEGLTGPEDWDFDRRIKQVGKVDIINVSLYHNEEEFNLKHYLKKKSYYSKSFDKYVRKWGRNDKIIRKQLGFWYRYIGLFLENGKWKRLFTHPILSFNMYFLRFLVGANYLAGRLSTPRKDL